MFLVFA